MGRQRHYVRMLFLLAIHATLSCAGTWTHRTQKFNAVTIQG